MDLRSTVLVIAAGCLATGCAGPSGTSGDCVTLHRHAAAPPTARLGQYVLEPESLVREGAQVIGLQAWSEAHFALSPDLSGPLDVTLGPVWLGSCGVLNGALRVTGAAVSEGGVLDVELTGDRTATVTPLGAGSTTLTLTGTYTAADDRCASTLPPGSELSFREDVAVVVFEPTTSRWSACASPVRGAVGRAMENPSLHVIAPDGREVIPVNALPNRALSYDVVFCGASAGTWAPWRDERSLTMPSEPGRILLDPAVGEPLEVEVVDVEDVEDFGVTFEVGGYAAGPTVLEDGGAYGPGWGRSSRFILATVDVATVGGTTLCTDVPPEWFTLTSGPVDRCAPRGPACREDLDFFCLQAYGQVVGEPVYAVSDGECTLVLSAPSAAGGSGFEERVSVTLSGVENMTDTSR